MSIIHQALKKTQRAIEEQEKNQSPRNNSSLNTIQQAQRKSKAPLQESAVEPPPFHNHLL